jgi:hypothetical protein
MNCGIAGIVVEGCAGYCTIYFNGTAKSINCTRNRSQFYLYNCRHCSPIFISLQERVAA